MPLRFCWMVVVAGALAAGSPPAVAHRGMTHASGEITLSDWPLCDVFVVRGEHGYSVVQWSGGLWVFVRGDEIYGRIDLLGERTLVSVGGVTTGRMTVSIDDIVPESAAAESLFRERCQPKRGENS